MTKHMVKITQNLEHVALQSINQSINQSRLP